MSFIPQDFLAQFAIPLVAGGQLHVSRPLDADDLEALRAEAASPDDEVSQLESLRQQAAARLWPQTVDTRLDEDALRLLCGVHNLLYFSHPQSRGATMRNRGLDRVWRSTRSCLGLSAESDPTAASTSAERVLEAIQPPADEAQMVARHTLLGGLCGFGRTDVEVRFWVGRRHYLGQRPPARLMYWRDLRNVREHATSVRWLATPLDDRQRDLLQRLFALSPLTDLLNVTRPGPRPRWATLTRYLRSPRIARLVTHHYIASGPAAGAALARDFWQLVDDTSGDGQDPSRAAAAVMLSQLLQYVFAARCVVSEPESTVDVRAPESSPLVLLLCAQKVGLLVPMERLGYGHARSRLEALLAQARIASAEATGELTARLDQAMRPHLNRLLESQPVALPERRQLARDAVTR